MRLCLLSGALAAPASHAQWPYEVPFVPSPQVVVDEMLRLANVTKDDFVMDLGSGDGRILITAAHKFGARGTGVDLDESLIAQSEENARAANVTERVQFLRQDLFKTDFSKASVITMYLLPGVNMRLRPSLLALKPGTRIVAHDFDLGDWQPDVKVTIRKNVMLWIVPAKIQGRWRLQLPLPAGAQTWDMDIRQKHQEIDGVVRVADRPPAGLWQASLRGDRVSFVLVDNTDRENEANMYFEGVVRDGVMEGEFRRGVGNVQTRHKWRATRTGTAP
ncbi:MAG: class I SAM-dependent methyltransferase [Burkholderiales bacterium]